MFIFGVQGVFNFQKMHATSTENTFSNFGTTNYMEWGVFWRGAEGWGHERVAFYIYDYYIHWVIRRVDARKCKRCPIEKLTAKVF